MKRRRSWIMAAAAGAAIGAAAMAYGQSGSAARRAAYALADGTFTGRREYAYYGFIKVQAVVRHGRLATVKVIEYPSDNGTSRYINGVALPYLIREAVNAQSHRVDLVSGATFTSIAFVKSLGAALSRAGA